MTPPPHPSSPSTVCVLDASVLLDMDNGQITRCLALLPYHVVVPDAVLAELKPSLQDALRNLGIEVGRLGPPSIQEMYTLRPACPSLSVADLFAFFVARDRHAILVTGDKRLTRLGRDRGLCVHGVLWVLDGLVARQALTKLGAAAALDLILRCGGRLPASECQKRLSAWRRAAGQMG